MMPSSSPKYEGVDRVVAACFLQENLSLTNLYADGTES